MPLYGSRIGLNSGAINAGEVSVRGDYISGVFKTYLTEADLQAAAISQNANRFTTGQIVYISGSNKLFILTSSFDDNEGATSIFSSSFTFPGSGDSVATGSLLTTASIAGNNLTFTKGNGSTFTIVLPGAGGSTFPYTGSAVISGSLTITGSSFFNGSINASSITSSFKGDLIGTASVATTAISSSVATTAVSSSVATDAISSSIATTAINANSASYVEVANRTSIWNVTAGGGVFKFAGNGFTGIEDAPVLYLTRGEKYRFSLNVGASHPFYIQTTAGAYNASKVYSDGVNGNGTHTGNLNWNVQFDTPTKLYYVCQNHPGMGNAIYIQNPTNTTGSFSGSFTGNLTGTASVATDAISSSVATTAISATSATSASYIIGGNVSGAVTSSISSSYILSSNVYGPLGANSVVSASYALSSSVEIIKEVSSSHADTASLALRNLSTASVSLNTITFTKGDGTTFPIIVHTGSAGGSGTGFPFSGSAVITGSLTVTGSAIPIQASGQSINIGTPSDTSYTDGFFDTFTSATSLANAIDEISEAFLDLAPAKAGVLTDQNLSNPSSVNGYLAAGLVANHWYQGFAAHDEVPIITSNSVTVSTPDTSERFRAGKNSDLSGSGLTGGVTGSIAYGNSAATLSIRALSAGTGTTDNINITSILPYNTFWAKANAQIPHTITAANTGSYKYIISSDNGAGSTNTRQVFWVGTTAQNYPNQTVTPGTVTSSSIQYNYLSGIPYLRAANFSIPFIATNLFNPVYSLNNVLYQSSYFSNLTTGSKATDTPSLADSLTITASRSLTTNTNSGQSLATSTIRVSKPGKGNVTSTSFDLSHTPINSYTTSQSSATIEYFLDEDKRDTGFAQTKWTPSATLTNGNLQVQNGRLIAGNTGDYTGFTGVQYYYRTFTGYSAGVAGGDFDFDNSGGTVFSSISAWGSGGDLEAIIVRPEDVSVGVPSKIYDLGRAQANSVAASGVSVPGGTADAYGIKLGSVGGLSGAGDSGWSFGTNTTIGASGELILLIKYSSASETKQLNQLSITT